jgi:hypothetical protein
MHYNTFLYRVSLTLDLAGVGDRRGEHRVLGGSSEGKRILGRTRRRWEDNINMDLLEVGCGGMDWIDLAQVKVAGAFECGNKTSGSGHRGIY